MRQLFAGHELCVAAWAQARACPAAGCMAGPEASATLSTSLPPRLLLESPECPPVSGYICRPDFSCNYIFDVVLPRGVYSGVQPGHDSFKRIVLPRVEAWHRGRLRQRRRVAGGGVTLL
mgnify:CR=1 FL=1